MEASSKLNLPPKEIRWPGSHSCEFDRHRRRANNYFEARRRELLAGLTSLLEAFL